MSTQLEDDISRKLGERLERIGKDHIDLCQAANLTMKQAAEILFATLGAFIVNGMAELSDITPEMWGKVMAKALRTARNRKKASA